MAEKGYPGARALIELHEFHLRRFVASWRQARSKRVTLPESSDQAYRSIDALLWHVLSCACRYIVWTAEALELSPPAVPELPAEDEVAAEVESFMEAILAVWKLPLDHLPLAAFVKGGHQAWWGTDYCVDAMLEHAVMHPLRHEWQLKKLIG